MSGLSDGAMTRLAEGLSVPRLPPRYRPVEIIGRGGMGVVWRARDSELERDVAIKVLAEHLEGESLTARLRREARILARLEHPGIVAVHDSGALDDGRAWYAMRLVRGSALHEAARGFEVLGDTLRVMMRLAETVAFAHAHGVVHRDLKPSNIMIGPFGEVLVLDWGVAGELHPHQPDEAGASGGAVVGTPGYLAPEQAAGLPADRRSDIFGLGAILRDLLSMRGVPAPRPLAAIRDRALAPEPVSRYQDALAFRDDLGRFQDGLAVTAYRESPLERAGRFVSRYRTPIVLVTAYLVMRLAVLLWGGI